MVNYHKCYNIAVINDHNVVVKGELIMRSESVRIDRELYISAQQEGKANFRTTPQQINFWAKVGKNALANPDLPVEFIAELLIAKESKTEPFDFGNEK